MSEEGIFDIIFYFLCSFNRPAIAFCRVSKCFSFEDCSNLLNKIEDNRMCHGLTKLSIVLDNLITTVYSQSKGKNVPKISRKPD